MSRISAVFIVTFLVIALTCGPALGQMWDYLPLTKTELGKRFPMKRVEPVSDSTSASFTLPAGASGVHFVFERHDRTKSLFIALGKDTKNRDWRVDLPLYCHFPPDFYVADLDGNGITDLVILVPTCGNGLAPTVHFFSLLFDEEGRPVPFEADGYFEGLPNGIDALVDMNRDGKAELIYMNYNDGYWITNVYQCQTAHWQRIQGQFGKRKYPLFTRFTNRPNRKAVTPKAGRHPFAPDLSNVTPLLTGHLTSFHIPESVGSDVELTMVDSKDSSIQCTPAYWYGSARVVLDGQDGRQIIELSSENKQNVSPILNEIISGKLRVLLYGKRYPDRCSPETVWATEDK